MYILGVDIGGTKSSVVTAEYTAGKIALIKKEKCNTDLSVSPEEMIKRLFVLADGILEKAPDAIGISCGGPLDSKKGIIMSPPNLPGWDNVEIVKLFEQYFGVKTKLQNDANACAMAEWRFGAGKGCENMIFLTFGTGLGAGLILDGKLYRGTNDNAGEVGHIRLDRFGPVGYGKCGSFEGFCSGGGIAQLGLLKALEKERTGTYPAFFKKGMTEKDITAKSIAEAADAGDETALEVYRLCGEYLGRGLSILIDILDPQVIVIGSVFLHSKHLLLESMKEMIEKEALPISAKCCKVVSAALGENIGDYAAVATALEI
ncbi:MAG: ROK family protein [Ruminococcaceae bacterium]|nr:ROK family protein [Oscillospiraceae bacterium]